MFLKWSVTSGWLRVSFCWLWLSAVRTTVSFVLLMNALVLFVTKKKLFSHMRSSRASLWQFCRVYISISIEKDLKFNRHDVTKQKASRIVVCFWFFFGPRPLQETVCCCGTSRRWPCTGGATPRPGAPARCLTSYVSEAPRAATPSSRRWCSATTRAGTEWTSRWESGTTGESIHPLCCSKSTRTLL